MDTKEIEALIEEKKGLFEAINTHNDNLLDAKSTVKYKAEDLWLRSDWDSIIGGKVTEKLKKAYVDSHLREVQEDVEKIENLITATYHEIEIIDDKLMFLGANND